MRLGIIWRWLRAEALRRRVQIALSLRVTTAALVALVAAQPGLPLEAFEQALAAYEVDVAQVRREGLTRALPGEDTERFFALGFALEQLHQNFLDLRRVVDEWRPEQEDAEAAAGVQ
jgi:hypothetical protein